MEIAAVFCLHRLDVHGQVIKTFNFNSRWGNNVRRNSSQTDKLGKTGFNDLDRKWKLFICGGGSIAQLQLFLVLAEVYKKHSVTKHKRKSELSLYWTEQHAFPQQVAHRLQAPNLQAETQLLQTLQQQTVETITQLIHTHQKQTLETHMQLMQGMSNDIKVIAHMLYGPDRDQNGRKHPLHDSSCHPG